MTIQQENGLKYRIVEHRGRLFLQPQDGRDGLKGPSAQWATYLRCPYSHRQGGYAISRRKIERMEWLDFYGYQPTATGRLMDHRLRNVNDPTAKGSRKRWHENAVDILCDEIRRRAQQTQTEGAEQ